MKNIIQPHYITPDWQLAAINRAAENPLVGVVRNGRLYFHFQDVALAEDLARQYWSGVLIMNVGKLLAAQKLIKDLIHRPGIEIEIKDENINVSNYPE